MHTVLFVESGTSGGGSFLSLKLLVKSLDKTRFRPVVAFLNRTRFYDEFVAMGVDCRLVFDLCFTKTIPWFIQKRFERLADRAHIRPECMEGPSLKVAHGPLLASLKRIVRDEGVDLLYSNNNMHRNVFMPMLARDAGLPLVCHLRSMGKETFSVRRLKYTDRFVDAYVAISDVVRDNWLEAGIAPRKVQMIRNALPGIDSHPMDLVAEFGVPQGDKTIGIVARMTWEKGHSLLLDAFCILLDRYPDVSVLMVGDGPKGEELKAKAEALGIAKKVVFCGYQARAHDIIASLDVLVQPSKTDPASRSVLEAMQLGVPAVVTKVGAIFEIMRDRETGFMVDEGDAPGLAEALEEVLTNESLRRIVAKNATNFVGETFDAARTTGRIEEIIKQVLVKHAARPQKP